LIFDPAVAAEYCSAGRGVLCRRWAAKRSRSCSAAFAAAKAAGRSNAQQTLCASPMSRPCSLAVLNARLSGLTSTNAKIRGSSICAASLFKPRLQRAHYAGGNRFRESGRGGLVIGTRLLRWMNPQSPQVFHPSTPLRDCTDMDFGILVRRWRAVRHVSQLDLALDAAISARHLSCIETGRAQPSREMVLRLARALQVPLSERNALLLAAGYAPLYRYTSRRAPELEAMCADMDFFLAQLEPNPVLILDRYWNILRMNDGAKRFFALFASCDAATLLNRPRLIFHPRGLRPFIENWELVAAQAIQRVQQEVVNNPSEIGRASCRER